MKTIWNDKYDEICNQANDNMQPNSSYQKYQNQIIVQNYVCICS